MDERLHLLRVWIEFYHPRYVERKSNSRCIDFMVSRSNDSFDQIVEHDRSNQFCTIFVELFGYEFSLSWIGIGQCTEFQVIVMIDCLKYSNHSLIIFRPTFNYFTWHTATIGLLGTLIMMFVINSIYASSSIILCLIMIIVLHLFSPSKNAPWGSISQALIFHQVRKYLLMLDSRKDHVKFWRPQMLLMISSPRSSCPLITFVNDLKKGGLFVIGHVKVEEFSGHNIDPTLEEYPHWLSLVDHLKVKAFVELTITKTVREGLHHLIRLSGMGAMKPNTIILGFYDEERPIDFFQDPRYSTKMFENITTFPNNTIFPSRQNDETKNLDPVQYVRMCSDVLRMKKNLCLCRNFHTLDKTQIVK